MTECKSCVLFPFRSIVSATESMLRRMRVADFADKLAADISSGACTVSRLLGNLQSCDGHEVSFCEPFILQLRMLNNSQNSKDFLLELLALALEPNEMINRTFASNKEGKKPLPSPTNFFAFLCLATGG